VRLFGSLRDVFKEKLADLRAKIAMASHHCLDRLDEIAGINGFIDASEAPSLNARSGIVPRARSSG